MTHIDTTFTITVEGSDGQKWIDKDVDSYCMVLFRHKRAKTPPGTAAYGTFKHIEVDGADMIAWARDELNRDYEEVKDDGLYSE